MSPIVLIGGGYQHYRLLHSLDDDMRAGRSVVLISKQHKVHPLRFLPYRLAGGPNVSSWDLDLWSVCQRKSVYFLEDECLHINREARQLQLKNFGKLNYQSLSMESLRRPLTQKSKEQPLSQMDVARPKAFIEKIECFFKEVHRHCPREVRVVIEGWRKESLELAALIRDRLKNSCEFCEIVLVTQKSFSERGFLDLEKRQMQQMKQQGLRILESVHVHRYDNHRVLLSDNSELECDVFFSLRSEAPSLLEKSMGRGQSQGSVGRDLADIQDSEIYLCGESLHFHREDRWIHEIEPREINKVLLHNIFKRQSGEPTIHCRDVLSIQNHSLYSKSLLFQTHQEVKSHDLKKWQAEQDKELSELRKIPVEQNSKKHMQEALSYQAQHMSRPWRGLVGGSGAQSSKSYQLTSFNGFNCWGSYGQSTIKICETALLKTLAKGIKPRQLRFSLTLPSHEPYLLQHIFESSFRALELVCDQQDIVIDGGDTFDGGEWHLRVTVGGEVYQNERPGIQPHDYLLITRPLGFGFLWAGRMETPFDSAWISHALRSKLLPSFKEFQNFVETYKPHEQILVEEWGFLFHSLEKLPGDQQLTLNFREVPRWEGIECLAAKKLKHPGLDVNWERVKKDVVFGRDEVSSINSILWDPLSQGALVFAVPAEVWKPALAALKEMGFESATLVGCTRPRSKGSRVTLSDWSPH